MNSYMEDVGGMGLGYLLASGLIYFFHLGVGTLAIAGIILMLTSFVYEVIYV